MNFRYTFSLALLCIILLFNSCKSDQKTTPPETPTGAVTDDHSGHNHDGHEHEGHNHDGHNHSDNDDRFEGMSDQEVVKMKAIEKAQAKGLINSTGANGVDISQRGIPNPCKLVSVDWLMKNVSLDVKSETSVKPGTKVGDSDNRSCFIQWEYKGDPNAGFLINIMVNPVPEEITNFPETYMLAKKMDGEAMVGREKPFPYKKINNLGVEALGCYELGKYYWRQDNDYLFMMAFNMDISQSEQEKVFMKIAQEVMKNFNASLK